MYHIPVVYEQHHFIGTEGDDTVPSAKQTGMCDTVLLRLVLVIGSDVYVDTVLLWLVAL
jgi:hypothetical protein